jgi:serine/threonine protein kinase
VSGIARDSLDAQVLQHLDLCAQCRVVIGEAARALDTGADAAPPGDRTSVPPRLTLVEGEKIMDRYEIVRFVARGGMGEVYEARDSVLNETVALKTMVCTALDDPRAMARLLAEVRLARQVTHRNVCRILEFGLHRPRRAATQSGESVPFLTMEFLRGETLAQRIAAQGRLEPAFASDLLAQMVAGLDAIHMAGIVHRDIKPQNMVLLSGSPERLVLTDFGLARSLEHLSGGASVTGSMVVGTLDYLAPERLEGKPLTTSVDLYALGVVIFEMLTGQKPFSGTDSLASCLERLRKPAPRPSDLVPTLDRIWDARVTGCLARDPRDRLARATDVLAPPARARFPWPFRTRLAPGLAAGVLVAATLLGAAVLARPFEPRTAASERPLAVPEPARVAVEAVGAPRPLPTPPPLTETSTLTTEVSPVSAPAVPPARPERRSRPTRAVNPSQAPGRSPPPLSSTPAPTASYDYDHM